MIKMNAEDF